MRNSTQPCICTQHPHHHPHPSRCAVAETGTIPPGNAPGETKWQSRTARPARPEIRLTAGKGISGATITDLIQAVVKDNRVRGLLVGQRHFRGSGFRVPFVPSS